MSVLSPNFLSCNNQQFDFIISLKMNQIVAHDLIYKEMLPTKQLGFNFFHPLKKKSNNRWLLTFVEVCVYIQSVTYFFRKWQFSVVDNLLGTYLFRLQKCCNKYLYISLRKMEDFKFSVTKNFNTCIFSYTLYQSTNLIKRGNPVQLF